MPPVTLTDELKSELDKALARQPDDDARLVLLAKQFGIWQERYKRFAAFGTQPFGEPHPVHGAMTAADFLLVLGAIDQAKAKLDRVPA